MRDLQDGETIEMQGSGAKPYVLKNTGGVYSCSCPAWRKQSLTIDKRNCKHPGKLRGDAAEEADAEPVHAATARRERRRHRLRGERDQRQEMQHAIARRQAPHRLTRIPENAGGTYVFGSILNRISKVPRPPMRRKSSSAGTEFRI